MTGWHAVELWPETVGERVASRSTAVSFRKGVLVVEVQTPAWMNELTYLKQRIIRDLNEKLEETVVLDIRLQLARKTLHLKED
jgi:predicted nucleic acid-binding Zn ribbon protein